MLAKPEGQDENRLTLNGETLPEIPATERVTELWRELGYARDSMAGAVPYEWSEVKAFADLMGLSLAPCEASCLLEMSRAYCVEIADRNPLRIAPMERTP